MSSMKMVLALCAALAAAAPAGVHAQACSEAGWQGRQVDPVAQGGRLYDKWWTVCGLDEPADTHPSYPAAGKQKGAATWRCKECHGWDYLGKDGAYRKGSHYTGIAGLERRAGTDPAAIVSILKDPTHRYGERLPDEALLRLAWFVSGGMIDSRGRIDPATKQVLGDPVGGRWLYGHNCIACHGADGQAMNFGSASEPEYLGTVAAENPWEALHKLRNGHPGAVMDRERMREARIRMHHHMIAGQPMPPMRMVLSVDQQFDLLRFLQTLPAE